MWAMLIFSELILDETIPASDVEKVIQHAGGRWLKTMRLFDLYTGEKVGEGKKSLAYRMFFQAEDRTLTDQEVDKNFQNIVRTLEKRLKATLRES